MAYESDEEQIEALKNWWSENGKSLIFGLLFVLAVLFGTRQWQAATTQKTELASMLYQEMVEDVLRNPAPVLADEDLAKALEGNNQLRSDFPKSIYTRYAALLMAKVFVDRNELEQAADEFNWVLENPGLGFFKEAEDELYFTTRLRLARVVLAQGNAQQAIELLTDVEVTDIYAGSYAEVQGDAHLFLGQIGDARAHYQQALVSAANPQLLQLKIDDLGE